MTDTDKRKVEKVRKKLLIDTFNMIDKKFQHITTSIIIQIAYDIPEYNRL